MTTTPAAPGPKDPAAAALRLSDLLRRPITGRGGESIGRLSDVIVRLRGADQPVVSGLVVAVGRRKVFVPIEQVASLEEPGRSGGQLRLTSARLDLRQFDRRDGEVLLSADVLGHRLIDVPSAHLSASPWSWS
jgi:sporulation protein YlmC with PRC-barrel domain